MTAGTMRMMMPGRNAKKCQFFWSNERNLVICLDHVAGFGLQNTNH